jgi:two-component system phosphate regulon response regulator PhoB
LQASCDVHVTIGLARIAHSPASMIESGEYSVPAEAGRAVIVEDEEDIRGLVAFTLRDMGWAAHTAGTGESGLALVASVRPSVLVLDLMLPDMSGIEVCRQLRSDPANKHLGVVMVTARGDEYDRLLGFEAGADDYVVKPFSVRELGLRVRALARSRAPRGAAWPTQAPFRWRGLVLDPLQHRVRAEGVDLVLRPIEFKILLLLMSTPDRAFTRQEIAVVVSHDGREGNQRTIDTHVSRLRDALGPYASAVETVPGYGYRLGPE